MLTTKQWAVKVLVYIINQANFMPDGPAKRELAKLAMQAPKDLQEAALNVIFEEGNGNGESGK